MGLDMYLMKQKKVEGVTPKQVSDFLEYYEWKNRSEREKQYTLKDWCGISYDSIPKGKKRQRLWEMCANGELDSVEVGYWRKANQIHHWFVENVQNGEDDCGAYAVSKSSLEELLQICKKVESSCKLVQGRVYAGSCWNPEKQEFEKTYEDGLVIENPSVAQELLPTQSGFFFGSEEYDEWYLESIKDTINIIEGILANTDFDEEIILYRANW